MQTLPAVVSFLWPRVHHSDGRGACPALPCSVLEGSALISLYHPHIQLASMTRWHVFKDKQSSSGGLVSEWRGFCEETK